MRVALISDIHGNDIALEAALADLGQAAVDQVVCLGDAVQGGPQPAEVVARLRELACPVVLGNADDWLLTGRESDAEAVSAERRRQLDEVGAWSLAQLPAADRAFIAGFTPTVGLALPGGRTLLGFHGSPTSYDDVILPGTSAAELQRLLGGVEATFMAGGHTHVQQLHHLGRALYIGCGSVGFAYRHGQPADAFRADPWAEYALLTVEAGRVGVEFRRVPFDVERLIAIYRSSGRPHAAAAIAQYEP